MNYTLVLLLFTLSTMLNGTVSEVISDNCPCNPKKFLNNTAPPNKVLCEERCEGIQVYCVTVEPYYPENSTLTNVSCRRKDSDIDIDFDSTYTQNPAGQNKGFPIFIGCILLALLSLIFIYICGKKLKDNSATVSTDYDDNILPEYSSVNIPDSIPVTQCNVTVDSSDLPPSYEEAMATSFNNNNNDNNNNNNNNSNNNNNNNNI